ncbi:MAG: LysR family transcriptional regulator [Erysipelotrichaceae bacterium]
MDIKLDWYKIFYEVCVGGSFSSASKKLFITQSAVSQSIHQLENNMQVILFTRTSKGVELTLEGRTLYEHVSTALNMIERGQQRIAALQSLEYGELKIGAADTFVSKYLLSYLEQFNKEYPKIHLEVINRTTKQIQALLNNGDIEIGFVNLPIDDIKLNIKPILNIHDIFVCGSKYKKYSDNPIDLTTLSSMPLILLEKTASSRTYLDDYFISNGINLNPEIELGSHELLLQLAKINLGVSCVIEEFSSEYLSNKTLYKLNLTKEVPMRKIALATRNDITLSVAAKAFIALFNK